MLHVLLAFAPLTFLIVYALKTRRMADAMVLGTLLSMVLLHRQHFLTGVIDALYATLSNSSYQFALLVIIGFGFMLSQANRELGLFDTLINSIGSAVPAFLIPPLAFLLVGLTVFAVGGCWVVMTIAIPVFVPLALSMGMDAPVIIAAVMSGIALGYSTCFYADAAFMTTAGTGVSNITVIRTALPYAMGAAAVSFIGFLLLGLR